MPTGDLHGRAPVMFGIMVALGCCTAFITRAYVANQAPPAEPVIIDPGRINCARR